MPALLAVRRLRADFRQTIWVTTAVSALLVVTFATSTLLTSAISTMNGSNQATVPPGQVYFVPPDDLPTTTADALRDEIKSYLGLKPMSFFVANGGVTLLDGSTVVVDSVDALETLSGMTLPNDVVEVLNAGGTVRTKQPDVPNVEFETADGTSHRIPASVSEGLGANYRIYDGFILSSAAKSYGIELVHKTNVFLNLSNDQLARAEGAPAQLGFDAEWLTVNKTPDVFTEPVEAKLAAATISLLAAAVMVFFVLSVTRLLRVNLSTMRAVGANRNWLTTVLATQTSVVVSAALVGAMVTSVAGMFSTIRISGLDLTLVVPWQSIGVTVLVLVAGTSIAAVISARQLSSSERFLST